MIAEIATTALCLGLVYSLSCRASMMSRSTRRAVRWSFAAHATAALALAVLPWVYPEARPYLVALLVAAALAVQWVTASLWPGVPPAQFQVHAAANDSKPVPLRPLSEDELNTIWRRGPRA